MEKIHDYEVLEKISETKSSLVYRGRKTGTENTVIIKSLKTRFPSASEIAMFKQEYDIIKSIDIAGIIKTYDVLSYREGFVLILEDFNGVSISRILNDKKIFDLKSFLNIAVKISGTLGELHKRNIIHRDIKPDNILISQNDGTVKITDFGISTVITHENDGINDPGVIQGALLYMSPEQTGRINRAVDYRSDLYSLGITMYKMLTGKVPFESPDPLEIIHSHIAREPVPAVELRPDIPHIISDIVMKLLAKNADDRYQNAFGLMHDFKECLERLDTEGKIKPFELSMHDISNRFIISRKLFGREKEIGLLKSAYERIEKSAPDKINSNNVQVVILEGGPGIGKSALIDEMGKFVLEKKGYFLSAKYERFRSNTPYSAITHAFQKLIKQILAESDDRIAIVKKNLLITLGPNIRILTDFIPGLEIITGRLPEVAKLGPKEAMNRFNIEFAKFVSLFAKKEHPFVICLDNLQWADHTSLQLIRSLITSPLINDLIFIGSVRDNEITESHQLAETFREIEKAGIIIERISLSELTAEDVGELIISYLKCPKEKVFPLTDVIYKKTGGNPFFLNEFLLTLFSENAIANDIKSGWKWDINKIRQMSITDNVVELLSNKINKLPGSVQEILKICACIGNRFDLVILSHLVSKSINETLDILSKAIKDGYIGLSGSMYMFSHDRIQEAAYSLVPDEEKPLIHHKIGMFALEKTDKHNLQNKLFYITDQLNLGSASTTDRNEITELVRLNLKSGEKAKTAAAFSVAENYFGTGMSLLKNDCWESQYDLVLSLNTEMAETLFLKGDYDRMDVYVTEVINNARDIYDMIPVYEIKIQMYVLTLNFKKSIDLAFSVLKKLDYTIPERPGKLRSFAALLKIRPYLSMEKIENLAGLPLMTDRRMMAVSNILSYPGTAALNTSFALFKYITIKRFEIFIKYGQSRVQINSYMTMAILLTDYLGNIEAGYKMGKMALELEEKVKAYSYGAMNLCLFNLLIAQWKVHLKQIRPELLKAYNLGTQTGNAEWISNSLFIYDAMGINTAADLPKLEREMAKNHELIGKFNQTHILSVHSIFWQMVLNLTGRSESPTELTGIALNEERMLPLWTASGAKHLLGSFYSQRIIIRYIFNDYKGAMDDSNVLYSDVNGLVGGLTSRDYYFYSSMTMLALYNSAAGSDRRRYKKFIFKSIKKFRRWSRYAPVNNEHRILMMQAEKARVLGRYQEAGELYDLAIEQCKKNDYLIEEAISNELAGIYYISWNKIKIAAVYLRDAYNCYSKWGASAKLEQLRRKYPDLISGQRSSPDTAFDDHGSSLKEAKSQSIDLITVVKASQTISGEVVLSKLLAKMMKIAIENAGAQKGFMILENQGRLLVEAEYNFRNNDVKVLESIQLDIHGGLPSSIINYVARTNGMLILNDAATESDFISDPYIIRNNPKSILCSPIINQGKLIGILYLENNLTTGAFTRERLEILNILSSQMAISIENARFYENLEHKVRERTRELEASEQRFKDIVRSSADWIWEADISGVFTYCSEQVEDIMGYKPEEIIGKRAYDFMPKDTSENTISAIDTFINQNKPFKEMEMWHTAKNGKKVCTIVCGVPVFNDKGESTGYRGLDRDITERKEAETKLKEIMKELSRSNKELEQFAYTVSHDLQEPLRKITTFGNRLKEKIDANKRTDYIERMQNASKRMQDLILGLLDYSRVTTKSRPFEKVDLNRVVKEVISDLEIKMRDTAGRVEAGELPFVNADSLQMRQLFQNIIGNALKFHKAGEPPLIRVYTLNEARDDCRIAVEDNGIGIEEKDYLSIFEVFRRLHGGSEYEGSGIGLAVCKKIMERHNGIIDVESKIGRGTKFIINFPAKRL